MFGERYSLLKMADDEYDDDDSDVDVFSATELI